MGESRQKTAETVVDKLVQERIRLLRADPEFRKVRRLIPKILRGKESGKDFQGVVADRELFEKQKNSATVLLSKKDMDRYQAFMRSCDVLGERHGLDWVTIENLAMGVKKPTVRPRLNRTITGGLDPIVFFPKDFNPAMRYVAHSTVAPPLAALEIMRRVERIDDNTKEEIKAYLSSIFRDKRGCRIVELAQATDSTAEQGDKIEFNICLTVPPGYTAKEVAGYYKCIDNRRRQLLASLGSPVPERRRQSKLIMKAEPLGLLKTNVNSYDVADRWFGEGDLKQDGPRIKAVRNMRYRGKKLVDKHLQRK